MGDSFVKQSRPYMSPGGGATLRLYRPWTADHNPDIRAIAVEPSRERFDAARWGERWP